MITLTPVKRERLVATPDLIGKYINEVLWSDVNPVGQIVDIKGKTTLIVARVTADHNKTKMEYIPGGFAGHCTNMYDQDWEFTLHENDLFEVNYSRTNFKKRFYAIYDYPRKFYDYNF